MPDLRTGEVAEIVKSAFELPPDEWPGFLDQACGEDAKLRAEVESLLHFGEHAPRFMEAPAVELAADLLIDDEALKPGARLGQFEICSLIASGGMGEVYLAHDTELDRKVALKVVKSGLGTASIVRHFRQEERILAGLNHPHIARLYGGGVTPEGFPYFIMEYVEGERLDHYCEARGFTTNERLALFRKVCSAVTYAHQHLVIHRDLKPANIRLTAEGEPKLLDFGIAKLIDGENTSGMTRTLPGMMTPEYASPEQVAGESITTASDVYTLGVVLYELLTGAKPYRLTSRRPEEISRAITGQEPTRPSTNRDSKIENRKSLRGDLDNIILMAMRKEPARRYESVAQFSADIQRHLDGLPVKARKDTIQYRSAKFVRRNKAGVLAAVLIAATLITGMAMTIRQKRRAERRFSDVRDLANSFLFEFYHAIEELPGSTPARVLLVNRALKYLSSLTDEAGNDPALRLELARAYLKVGDMQGSPYRPNIGDTAAALTSYRKALALLETLSSTDGTNADLRYNFALANESIGRVQMRQAAWADALESEQKARAICEQLVAAEPANALYRKLLADTYMQLGMAKQQNDAAVSMENFQQACALFQQAISIHETLLAAEPTNGEYQHALGADYGSLGYTQRKMGDLGGDAENYHRAVASHLKELEINEALLRSAPANPSYLNLVAVSHMDVANSQMKLGQATDALPHFRRYLETNESLAAADPTNVEYRMSISAAHLFVSKALAQTGELAVALDYALKARERYLTDTAADPTNAEHRLGHVQTLDHVGYLQEKTGDPNGALEHYDKALAVLKTWLMSNPESLEVRRMIAAEESNIAHVQPASDDPQ